MANLAEAVDAAETDWLVSADIPDSVDYLTVESEVVQVTATFPAQYQARDGSTSAPRIRVVRAAGGTTAASHADGTALTPLIPPSAASGGAAEPGTVVQKVTGTGTATGRIFIGDVDPATDPAHPEYAPILEGEPWIDTSFGWPWQNKIRNDVGGWVLSESVLKDVSGNIIARMWVDASDGAVSMLGGPLDNGLPISTVVIYGLNGAVPGRVELLIVGSGLGAGGSFALDPDGTFTFFGANVILPDAVTAYLPTSNPGPDKLWNDTGTVKVGT